jgi:phytanoyl-CoA hydroxylase
MRIGGTRVAAPSAEHWSRPFPGGRLPHLAASVCGALEARATRAYTWFDQIRDPRVVNVVGDLLGPDINFFNGKARIKPPGYVNTQGWHQDWPYERHTAPDLAAAIVYLDDTGPGEGATRIVPGSHRRGEWPHDERNTIPDTAVTKPEVEVTARAGDVAFIHVLVVHRAGDNPSGRNRTAIINEYKTQGTRPLKYQPLAFNELPLLRGGRPTTVAAGVFP